MTPAPRKATRRCSTGAFTLIEVLIASTLTLVTVTIALEFAARMLLHTRKLEQQADLAARASVVASFLPLATDGIGYGWSVRQRVGNTTKDTGSFGVGFCSVAEVCPTPTTLPLQFCEPSTVSNRVCAPPLASQSAPDALRFFSLRDGALQAVRIVQRRGSALPGTCALSSSTTFEVRGVNESSWTSGDVVLVAKDGHVSVLRVSAPFAPSDDATALRLLTLDLPRPDLLALDDGGAAGACNAEASLKDAAVFRVRLSVLRLQQATSTLEWGGLSNTNETFSWVPVLAEVDDFQVRLDLIQHTVKSGMLAGATPCFADSASVLSSAEPVAACNAARLNARSEDGDIVRLIGLRFGLLLRSVAGVESEKSFVGLFDRTSRVGSDRRLRRSIFVFSGLPHALL
jgi:hypothetical protein